MKTQRIRKLQQQMQRQDIDAAVIMQPRDLFYYTQTAQPCNLVVPARGAPALLVRRGAEFVRRETWMPAYEKGGGPKQILKHLQQRGITRGRIGLEFDTVPYGLVQRLSETLCGFVPVNISGLILEQRMIKDADEIGLIRKATERFDRAHAVICSCLRPGLREIDLGGRIAAELLPRETEQVLFIRRWDDWLQPMGTIAGGENLTRISGHAHTVTGVGLGPALPWGPSTRELQPGDLVVIDNPLNYRGYHSDNTRTYVVGKATARQREIYRDVLSVQDDALACIRPGMRVNALYAEVAGRVQRLGYADYFQGFGDSRGQYLGHGVGLELDEPPVLDGRTSTTIAAGMVLAVECKFIIPDFGAVFIEDTVVVEDHGAVILSRAGRELAETG